MEKHNVIDRAFGYFKDEFGKHDGRIKKVENRFLAMMTILIANLIGIIISLGFMVLKLQ